MGKKRGSKTMKYRKKPIVVDAISWNGNNLQEVMDFVNSEFKYVENVSYCTQKFNYDYEENVLIINTLEGSMVVHIGDYIIKGIAGEYYPCKKKIFEETYEVVKND